MGSVLFYLKLTLQQDFDTIQLTKREAAAMLHQRVKFFTREIVRIVLALITGGVVTLFLQNFTDVGSLVSWVVFAGITFVVYMQPYQRTRHTLR